jgi:hypothetical protein
MIGYPESNGKKPLRAKGILSDYSDKMLRYQIFSDMGNSGSPIYYIDG